MRWSQVESPWQSCFELAWQSHLEGSNPIAALVEGGGKILATGKSAVRASVTGVVLCHNEIAHAEVNALLALDNRSHPKSLAADYTLYATLEPCPVCFSAFYMSDVATLRYAARDRFSGSTNLLGTTPYLSRKRRTLIGPEAGLGDFSIFLNVYHDLNDDAPQDNPVHAALAEDYPDAVELAREIVGESAAALDREPGVGRIFDRVMGRLADHG